MTKRKKAKDHKNDRVGAGAVNRIYGPAEPEPQPKKIFAAPQYLFK